MHLTYRSKTRILLSMIALLGIVGAMLVAVVTARTTYAAVAAASAQFHGTPGTAIRLSTSRPSLTNPTNAGGKRMIPNHIPAHATNTAALASMPGVSSTALDRNQGSLLHNFNGLSDIDQAAVNGGSSVGEVTPPDQGLCVGFDPGVPGTKVVFQAVNSALRETSVNNGPLTGAPLLGNKDVSFANFWEPGAFSDPRCFFLNSFPFADADITPNPISQQLGFWTVTHDIGVSNGHPGNVTLTGVIIRSEIYGFPVNAVSTGTGVTDNNGITSEAFLNPDDSRMQQVQFINGHLWAALTQIGLESPRHSCGG